MGRTKSIEKAVNIKQEVWRFKYTINYFIDSVELKDLKMFQNYLTVYIDHLDRLADFYEGGSTYKKGDVMSRFWAHVFRTHETKRLEKAEEDDVKIRSLLHDATFISPWLSIYLELIEKRIEELEG